jgi:HAD superfamily hydrolase (TIGR01490 family)
MKIALFDFDGTITTNDSLVKFIQFSKGEARTFIGMILLSPMLIAYKLKFIPNYKAKQWLFSHYFKGIDEIEFDELAKNYSLNHLHTILRPEAIKKIEWHKQENHKIVVVSASIESWLKPWCDANALELIATQLEINEGKLTGRFSTKNCYGIEKAKRVKEKFDLSEFEYIYAYGDSRGDRELLELANEKYYQKF